MSKYQNLPRTMRNMLFKAKCRKGKFEIQKIENLECMVLPEVNDKIIKKLKNLAAIRCWKNLCVSDNLRRNEQFMDFAKGSSLKIMNGKWLFKNVLDDIIEYMVDIKGDVLGNQEISILCHQLDEVMAEKIKEICQKVKVCNLLTDHVKCYQRLEEEVYQETGMILNITNNYKKAIAKSKIVINFDFSRRDLRKCVFAKGTDMIQVNRAVKFDMKEFGGKNIVFYGIDMPEKYIEYQEKMSGFNSSILYESLIYKRTSYRNIKKELEEDEAKILYLVDLEGKVIKNQNLILPKTLDKMTI